MTGYGRDYGKIVGDGPQARCSLHGDTITLTTGQWTGREMLECMECGTYVVIGETARGETGT